MKRIRKGLDIAWSPERLVAVHFMNGLGNFIQMTPAIQALAEHYNASVDIILDRKWTDSRRASVELLCRNWSLISKIYDFQDGFNQHNYIQMFYARHGERCEAAAFFRKNSGYDADHINWRLEKLNEVDYYMKEAYKLGYRGKVPRMFPFGHMNHPRGMEPKSNPPELQEAYFRVGFCNGFFTGAAMKWERKGWPYFPELARLLRRYYSNNIRIALLGKGENEQEWAQTVKKVEREFGEESWIYDETVGYDLFDTNNYLFRADLIVTTDTGLMHIADAHKTPTVALFGPTILSKNGPYNKEHRIARSPLRCAPCQDSHHFHACEDWRCMRELKPWMVMQTIRRYVYDLVKRKHTKTIDLDKGELERCKGLEEGRTQHLAFKRVDLRKLRGCLRGKLEL